MSKTKNIPKCFYCTESEELFLLSYEEYRSQRKSTYEGQQIIPRAIFCIHPTGNKVGLKQLLWLESYVMGKAGLDTLGINKTRHCAKCKLFKDRRIGDRRDCKERFRDWRNV